MDALRELMAIVGWLLIMVVGGLILLSVVAMAIAGV